MFYRFIGDRRKTTDFIDTFHGDAIFLLGGHPSLLDENLDLLKSPGIVTMAMNNTATIVRPNLWICADSPLCYSESIIKDPGIIKLARLNYTNTLVDGKMWKDYSNTYFYGTSDTIKFHEFLEPSQYFVWWKNVFMIAIQACYRFGFRKIYTAGCSFNISRESLYSYDSKLDDGQIDYNQKTYNMITNQLQHSKKSIDSNGLEIVSCTPDSKLNSIFPYQSLSSAVDEVLRDFPKHDTLKSKHSSMTK